MMLEEIFNEIIKEAKTGQVEIDNDIWPVAFNTVIYEENTEKILWNDNNNITLIIKKKERLLELLENYINLELKKQRKTITFFSDKEKNHIKWLMTYLFVNATTEDFMSPIKLVTRYTRFLRDDTFDCLEKPLEIKMDKNLLESTLRVQKKTNSTSMETPYRIDMELVENINGQEVSYPLPSIYYGISNNKCYIYSVMMPKAKKELTEEETKFAKKINRALYKINQGIQELENQDYFIYKEGKSNYYPEENITDVTHSFVLAINTFISLLQVKKIPEVRLVTYLPLRYQSREIAAQSKEGKQREEFEERNDSIQQNITNKIIRTIRRLSVQNPSVKIKVLPYEVDEFLTTSITPTREQIENPVLANTGFKLKLKAIPQMYDSIDDNKTIKYM